MKKSSKTVKFAKDLIEIFLPETKEHSTTEGRWRQFLRNLQKGLLEDQQLGTLGKPGEWKTPNNLEGNEITMFELLRYPNMKSTDPKEAKLRDLGRQMYQAINDPETFYKTEEFIESLIQRLQKIIPHIHRLVLAHPDVRSNAETCRWEHHFENYRGAFSQEMMTITKSGATLFQINFNPTDHTFTHTIKEKEMVGFAQTLKLI